MCGECDGQCRQGLPVADVLRFLTYADGYGQFALGRERFLGLDAAHTAVRCSDCPGCTVQCPYGVHVARAPDARAGPVRMLKLVCGIGLFAGVLAAANPACSLVPGWTQQGEARSFAADNLFEYMDGNAEGYLLYGFQNMHGVTCVKDGVTLVIDISDFGDADSAYGMFCANRDLRKPPAKLGMGGQIVPRRAIFAKGPYYVEIGAEPGGRPHRDPPGVDGRARKDRDRQQRGPGRALLVSVRRAAVAPPGAGERPRHPLAEARLRGAVRFRQGVRGHGSVGGIGRRRDAEAARALRRNAEDAHRRRCIPGHR